MDDPPTRDAPEGRYEYRAPSLLVEYKYLAIAFVLAIVAVCIYLIRAPRQPLTIAPAPAAVYIVPVPNR